MTSTNDQPISIGTRLGTMFLDHVFMTMIAFAFFLPATTTGFSNLFSISHEKTGAFFMERPMTYIALFGCALYFCKDILDGRSIAKRILKLQVVDNKTGKVATPLQCFVRNIFCIFWIIEVIVAITNPNRRLGDRVAGTKIVYYNPPLQQPKIDVGRLLLPIIVSYGLIIFMNQLIPSVKSAKIIHVKASYNSTESKKLQQIIIDSLGKYLIPDVKLYEPLKNENLKYLSVILELKENWLTNSKSYQQLHQTTTNLIYSMFPIETFTGHVEYIYKSASQFERSETAIGTYSELIQAR